MVGATNKFFFGCLTVTVAGLLFALQANVFYQSGKDWFDTCWKAKNSKDAKPATAEEAVKWAQCDATAKEAVYGAGFVMAGRPQEGVPEKIKAVYAACPSAWSDLSLFHGEYGMAVDLIEKTGGPSLVDRFLPATFIIERAYRSRWPNCDQTRQQAGYPRITRKKSGEWEFESECEPCKVERDVAQKLSQPLSNIDIEHYIRELDHRERQKASK